MIELRNIDLSGITPQEQDEKLKEELTEFYSAMNFDDIENIKEELFDVLQAMLGVAFIEWGITAEELMEYYPKHLEKLKNRPRDKEA